MKNPSAIANNNKTRTTKVIIFLMASCMQLSCNPEKPPKSATDNKYNSSIEVRTLLKTDRSFLVFFEKFMWDKVFQESRVLFPIHTKDTILKTSQDWIYLPFYTQDSYIAFLSSDTLSIEDKDLNNKDTDFLILNFTKKSADKYSFKQLNKNWYLHSIESIHTEQWRDKEFIDFLILFSNDSVFQIKHVLFPLPELFSDQDNNHEIIVKMHTIENWKFLKLTEEINSLMVVSDSLSDNPYRNIVCRGIENGIWVKYTFKKINNDWTLIQLEDYST